MNSPPNPLEITEREHSINDLLVKRGSPWVMPGEAVSRAGLFSFEE